MNRTSKASYIMPDSLRAMTIPLKRVNNFDAVEAEINGVELLLILDSGMPMEGVILYGKDKIRGIGLSYSGKILVGGVGGDATESDLATGVTVNCSGLRMSGQTVIVMPIEETNRRFEGIDGIIGFSFFANFIVKIDNDRQLLTLIAPDGGSETQDGQWIPVSIRGNRIFINAGIGFEDGSTIQAELVADTGNQGALVLNSCNNPAIALPRKTFSKSAFGLTKALQLRTGRIRSIAIGSHKMNGVIASFNEGQTVLPPPWEKDGNLGNGILRRFNVTFNIPGGKILLERNTLFDKPFEFNMAGIQFRGAGGNAFEIAGVIPGSPANEADLKAGDLLISVNGLVTSDSTTDQIESEFLKQGSDAKLTIERSGSRFDVTLRLRRII